MLYMYIALKCFDNGNENWNFYTTSVMLVIRHTDFDTCKYFSHIPIIFRYSQLNI